MSLSLPLPNILSNLIKINEDLNVQDLIAVFWFMSFSCFKEVFLQTSCSYPRWSSHCLSNCFHLLSWDSLFPFSIFFTPLLLPTGCHHAGQESHERTWNAPAISSKNHLILLTTGWCNIWVFKVSCVLATIGSRPTSAAFQDPCHSSHANPRKNF